MAKGKERTSISGHHATSNVHERATLRKVPNSKRGKFYHEEWKRQKEKKKYAKDRKGTSMRVFFLYWQDFHVLKSRISG